MRRNGAPDPLGRPSALPDPRLLAALASAKLAGAAIRRLGRGGGTAAPGLVADRLDPALLTKIARRLERGAVVVAGTNGKTTVSRMLADILEADGLRVAHNRSGSNLVRGVAAALAERATLGGDPRADVAVIEADEAAFPAIVRRISPRLVLLNNLFRDQLDRYGELDTIAKAWRAALLTLPADTVVVVNVDDPGLAEVTRDLPVRRLAFGLDEPDPRFHLAALPHAADAATCRRCGHDLDYAPLYSAHLGAWRCPNCGAARPPLAVLGTDVHLEGVEALRMTVERRTPPASDDPGGDSPFERDEAGPGRAAATEGDPPPGWSAGSGTGARPPLLLNAAVPGLYNAYNVIAAVAAAGSLGVPDSTIARALAAFRAPFGRIERVAFRDRTLVLALVKNPVGFNETLRMLTLASGALAVPTLIAINDLAADGRDVSWLWDVDFELLADGTAPLSTTGLRGPDMANRLKYAGVPPDRLRPLPADLRSALEAFVETVPPGAVGYVLPTYTAMLGLRRALADLGAVETFWKQ